MSDKQELESNSRWFRKSNPKPESIQIASEEINLFIKQWIENQKYTYDKNDNLFNTEGL